jgi:outer membrane scaffolding protein for murein synthesis (MipA/OmpV family)
MLPALRNAAISCVLAAGLMAAGPVAQAQAPVSDWSFPTEWQAGGIVIVAPKYEGSRDHRVIGLPIIAPAGTGEGRVQVKGADDVRIRLVTLHGLEVGAVTGWRFGREEDDSRRLRGLGDVDGGLALGGYAAYRLGMVSAFASYSHQATGDETGGLLRFGLESRMPVTGGMTLTALAGATWASEDYMRSYFGVSAAQAARSGLATYDANAGIKDVHVGLSAEIPLAEVWTLRLMGRYARLVGDASDSPIVERQDQLSGGVGLTYKFSLGR